MTFDLNDLLSPTQPILLEQIQILDVANGLFSGALGDRADLLITTDRQLQLNPTDFPPQVKNIAAEHLILGNGLVDLYSTSGQPGFESRETWTTLANAARHGGFVRVGVLPPLDKLAGIEMMRQQAPASLGIWAAITKGGLGKELNDLAELAPQVLGFTDAAPVNQLRFLRRSLEYLQPFGKPIMIWAYDLELANQGVMREGRWSLNFGLSGVPAIAETSAIAAAIELIEQTRCPVHLMRISTARSVELIAQAQSRGLPISASVVWHHLLHDLEELASYDPNLHLSPPLGDRNDRQALIQGIKSGVIGAIAIDHTPFTYEEKAVAFEHSPPGALGLEFALPLLWHHLVKTNKLSALELWRSLSLNPASYLGIPQPELVTIFDPEMVWQVNNQNMSSLAANSVWFGKPISGKALAL
jgi:dihydroorotase